MYKYFFGKLRGVDLTFVQTDERSYFSDSHMEDEYFIAVPYSMTGEALSAAIAAEYPQFEVTVIQ
ncbi:MAG: hypothetical protein EOM62_14195 [Bacteroidia bacterium]|nr:hypothetical protein [Bacteroidia bacterium]